MTKGVDERWFSHVERMKKERIAMRVYIGELVRQGRKIVQNKSEW